MEKKDKDFDSVLFPRSVHNTAELFTTWKNGH